MIQKIKEILNKPVEDVIKDSELSVHLMKLYSLLYLSGKSPRFCEKSQRAYYSQLKKNGMDMAVNYNEVKSRTLIPTKNIDRNIYNPRLMKHINFIYLTDKEAVTGLAVGALSVRDFKKLPKAWILGKKKFGKNHDSKRKIEICLREYDNYLKSLETDEVEKTEEDSNEVK